MKKIENTRGAQRTRERENGTRKTENSEKLKNSLSVLTP